jgi:glutaredoxin-like protein
MEKLLNEEIQKQLKDVFNELKENVEMVLFIDKEACESCEATQSLLSEVADLSDKLSVSVHNLDSDLAKTYDITMAPSFVMLDGTGAYKGVKFNGIPAGHEINSFISALIEMSGAQSDIPAEILERIQKIDKPVNIKVFVTLSCPHCPGAVQKAHKIAMLNPNVVGEMIEAQTFPELSNKFNVSGVPKIIINDSLELVGNQPIERFLDQIESL